MIPDSTITESHLNETKETDETSLKSNFINVTKTDIKLKVQTNEI